FFLSGMLYDDGVIDPRDTRTVLAICLSVLETVPIRGAERYGAVLTRAAPQVSRRSLMLAPQPSRRAHDQTTPRRQPRRDRPAGVRALPPPRERARRGALRRRRRVPLRA